MALVLYCIVNNLGGMFFQLRGVPPGQVAGGMAGFVAGYAAGALLMDIVERRVDGPRSILWLRIFLVVLLLPGLLGLPALTLSGFQGNRAFNLLLPMLWTVPTVPALRLFFRHSPSSASLAVWLGLAFGAGHLCWTLIMPLARFGMATAHSDDTLFFINLVRCLLAVVLAVLVWRVLAGQATSGTVSAATKTPRADAVSGVFHPRRNIWLLLAALFPCFLMNGFLDLRLSVRVLPFGIYPEMVQLFMVFLLPLAGLPLPPLTA